MKTTLPIILITLLLSACNNGSNKPASKEIESEPAAIPEGPARIPVLNFATFHMGFTSDASSVEFDEHNSENRRAAHEIAAKLADFKPTVILVENRPEQNEFLQKDYAAYRNNPDTVYDYTGEIRLIAYELGRLAEVDRIYGIDHKMGYNYMIGEELEVNAIDSNLYRVYYEDPESYYPSIDVNEDSLNLLDKLILNNQDRYLDFMITVNADALTFAGSENGFEGADEAAKYYQRNLRMFSNMNRIELDESDRVFVLMGSSHTAFFRDFISRSPKYEMVNTFDYLK